MYKCEICGYEFLKPVSFEEFPYCGGYGIKPLGCPICRGEYRILVEEAIESESPAEPRKNKGINFKI